MAAAGHGVEDEKLFDTVKAVGMELCPELGISIPVGKDSLSMRTVWKDDEGDKSVAAPVSLIISAFAPVVDVRSTLTPQLRADKADTELLLIDLGQGKNRLGGSALAQVYNQLGDECADLDDAKLLKQFFAVIQQLNQQNLLLAYHDRSDGGLLATLVEMAFAGHVGVDVDVSGSDAISALFNEELGAVIQVCCSDHDAIMEAFDKADLSHCVSYIGSTNDSDTVNIRVDSQEVFSEQRVTLQRWWMETSYNIQALRDNPSCAQQEFDTLLDAKDPGLSVDLTFDATEDISAPYIAKGERPRIAILREQGVNGHVEMAAAFDRAGFAAVDVHMSDILSGRQSLTDFKGLAACGGLFLWRCFGRRRRLG